MFVKYRLFRTICLDAEDTQALQNRLNEESDGCHCLPLPGREKLTHTDRSGTCHMACTDEDVVMTSIAEQLSQAIARSEKTRCRISQETGIDEAVLSRFINRERELSLTNVDVLCKALGLRAVSCPTSDAGGLVFNSRKRYTAVISVTSVRRATALWCLAILRAFNNR